MRDDRFKAIHRGGTLSMEKHRLLIRWAIACVERGIETLNPPGLDVRALKALETAKQWEKGNAAVGDARKAAFAAHDAARESGDASLRAVYRACGHAAATAHMADHALQAGSYVIKGLSATLSESELKRELDWQIGMADERIKYLIEKTKVMPDKGMKPSSLDARR